MIDACLYKSSVANLLRLGIVFYAGNIGTWKAIEAAAGILPVWKASNYCLYGTSMEAISKSFETGRWRSVCDRMEM